MSPKPRVLIVDDNVVDFRLLKDIFLATGIPVEIDGADNGQTALEYLLRTTEVGAILRPQLILLDLNLPKLSGMELLQTIKAHAQLKRIPVVMMTSSRAARDVAGAYEAGANLYIRKPSDLEGLEELIAALAKTYLKFAVPPELSQVRAPYGVAV